MSSLWRVHYSLSKLLALVELQKTELLAGTLGQMPKSVYQVAPTGPG